MVFQLLLFYFLCFLSFCNSSGTLSSNETLDKSMAITLKEKRTKTKSYSESHYLKLIKWNGSG